VRFFRKLPQAWTERLNSAMGGDQIFLGDVDHHARAAYERRARGLDASQAPSDRDWRRTGVVERRCTTGLETHSSLLAASRDRPAVRSRRVERHDPGSTLATC